RQPPGSRCPVLQSGDLRRGRCHRTHRWHRRHRLRGILRYSSSQGPGATYPANTRRSRAQRHASGRRIVHLYQHQCHYSHAVITFMTHPSTTSSTQPSITPSSKAGNAPFRIAIVSTMFHLRSHTDVIATRWTTPRPADKDWGWTGPSSEL